MIVRSGLLLGLSWLLAQKGKAVFTILDKPFDLASLVMLGGGLFLIYKSVHEIHQKLEGEDVNAQTKNKKQFTFSQAIVQIVLVDMVFSFDSVITAGGTAKHVIEGWAAEKAEGLHLKNYIYFGMAFSFIVEVLNMVMLKRQNRRVVQFDEPQYPKEELDEADTSI